MFFRPIHIFLITLAAFLFSFQKSNAGVSINVTTDVNHIFPANVSHLHQQIPQEIIDDILTDINDEDEGDDETSSKTKHKLPKITITAPTKFASVFLTISSVIFQTDVFSFTAAKHYLVTSLFNRISISIAIRCLRI